MNCPYCNTPSDPSNPFCRNCGQVIHPQQPNPYPAYAMPAAEKDKSLLYLMIIIGWGLLSSILWIFVSKYLSSHYLNGNGAEDYLLMHRIANSVFAIIGIGMNITFTILTKNNSVRVFLIIYTITNLLVHLFYIFGFS